MFAKIRHLLERPHAVWWITMVATLLVSTSVTAGLAADDYMHELMLRGSGEVAGLERSPLDLFRFADPSHNRDLLRAGVFPWWADLDARFAFFRPLASATHWLDHVLWGNTAWLRHVHNLLWHVLALASVAWLYREVVKPHWVAVLAFALYALDDGRGAPVAWVANRNALIACTFCFVSVAAHHVARSRPSVWMKALSPAALLCGLLAGEGVSPPQVICLRTRCFWKASGGSAAG